MTEGGYRPWFVYYFFNGLLLSLQVLHIIWFSFIFRMAWRWVTTGEMKKDARSDTDDGSASDNEGRAKPDKAHKQNGSGSISSGSNKESEEGAVRAWIGVGAVASCLGHSLFSSSHSLWHTACDRNTASVKLGGGESVPVVSYGCVTVYGWKEEDEEGLRMGEGLAEAERGE